MTAPSSANAHDAAIGAAGLHGAFAAAIANLSGSFLLGLILGHLQSGKAHPLLGPFISVGVFGSFTTVSALALDNRGRAHAAGEIVADGHLLGSIVLGLAVFALGCAISGHYSEPALGRGRR